MRIKVFLFFLVNSFFIVGELSAVENYTNFYIIVETDTQLGNKSIQLASRIITKGKALNAKEMFIRDAGDRSRYTEEKIITWKKFNKYKSSVLPNITTFKNSTHSVSSAEVLSLISGDIEKFKWKASDTVVIYIGDMIYEKGRISSRGGYLSLGFLNNPKSPFKTKFIDTNSGNNKLNGLSFIVLGIQNVAPNIYEGQKTFIASLLHRANSKINFLHYGSSYNALDKRFNAYSIDMLKASLNGSFSKITQSQDSALNYSELASIHLPASQIHNVGF